MLPDPSSFDHPTPGTAADLRIGAVTLRSRTDVPFLAAIGAMVIGILLAVTAIIGAARARR